MADAINAANALASVGQNGYENGDRQSGMPPPPQPQLGLNIPANTNPAPQESQLITSPGGTVSRAAPEPNKRALYVGGLDPRVTEEVLKQIFETTGHVQNVKIIPDKNFQSKGYNYGFVEYDDPGAAERAMQTLNGRRVHQQEIRVNWAYQSNNTTKEDTSNHFHIFVGDLSNEVNDEVLLQAFSAFGTVSEARVMWDMKTGRSRGYGFVAYRDRGEAEKALSNMDGEWLGSRAIRCNWANQKGQPSYSQQQVMAQMGMTPTTPYGHHTFPTQGAGSYEMVLQQTPQWQTTCYVGNLTPYTTQNDLVPLFQNFGYVTETRFQSDRGFAFVKMDTHENAASAICQLNGYQVNGRPLKCSWGKDRPPTGQFDGAFSPAGPPSAYPGPHTPAQPHSAFPPQAAPYFPQYGQPPAMSPQSAPPIGQFHHPPAGSWPPAQTPQAMHQSAGGWPQGGMPPQSAGGFGQPPAQHGYPGQPPQGQQPFGRGGYGGYPG
ncbi:hypothetical protein B0A48_16612 [Cryoendolithus antarcticus]|uniref:RRM domain-containing protein n=1 Tax=Cryoendolithus antarcticus TaxID=1507870 RepID=A0A1V8SED5_9PEZI|nr:hypothetical protein B0A48_16612 [Cryoendolithus antarcticus]